MKNFFRLLKREIGICMNNFSIFFSFSTFFITSSLIFVFALDDLTNIVFFYKPVVWVVLIFSIMLVSENFLHEDYSDGSLKELQFLGFSEETIFLCKSLTMWLMILIPAGFLMPIILIFFNLSFNDVIKLFFNILISTPSLTLISLLSALFSIQLKRNKIVQFVIILPFFIPIVIFTTTSEKFAEPSKYFGDQFLILIGIFFITLPVCLYASKLIMREINK